MINYPITADYVADWGLQEALREIIQNALDAGGMKIEQLDTDHWVISNQGSFSREVLLLGNSIKAEGSIGKYGEGMKLALLVLARLKISHCVFSPNMTFEGKFSDALGFEQPTFSIFTYDEDSTTNEAGIVEVHIYHDIGELVDVVYKEQEIGFCDSGLYINGLYVSDLPGFKFGYNMPRDGIELDRDRRTVDTYIVKRFAAEQILKHCTAEDIAEMLFDQVQDVECIYEKANRQQDEAIGLACAQLVKRKLGSGRIGYGFGNSDYTKVGYHFHHYAVNVGKCQDPEPSAAKKALLQFVEQHRNKMRRDVREALLALKV